MTPVEKLIAHVQALLDDAGIYNTAIELYDLNGNAWAEEATRLIQEVEA